MSDTELVRIIRAHYGCGMHQAKNIAEKLLLDERAPTKRELFAAMAMQGLCVMAIPGGHNSTPAMVAELPEKAVALADALLAELAKERP